MLTPGHRGFRSGSGPVNEQAGPVAHLDRAHHGQSLRRRSATPRRGGPRGLADDLNAVLREHGVGGNDGQAVVTVRNLSEQRLEELGQGLNCRMEMQPLSLEEIYKIVVS